ncbi:MAG: hypothetical protein D6679_03015, partial [Candidatus Hydrogenedentota bacterium]
MAAVLRKKKDGREVIVVADQAGKGGKGVGAGECFRVIRGSRCVASFLLGGLFFAFTALPSFGEEIRIPGASYRPVASDIGPGSRWSPKSEQGVYRIGASDVLDIAVWQSPDLNRVVTVRFDGRISFPLAGEIVAAGLTPQELGMEIGERLREFIRNPQVTVTVKEFHSRQVLVLGDVSRPGIYPLQGPMKLLELLTAAGVDLESADLKNISVIRSTGEVLKLDVEGLLYRQDVRQNIDLRAGDNVFVPERIKETKEGGKGVAAVQAKEIMVLGEV